MKPSAGQNYISLLAKAAGGAKLRVDQMAKLLLPPNAECERELFAAAYKLKRQICGDLVNLRGLIELSNICTRDCLYCGIRKSNSKVNRYTMGIDEVLEAAELAGKFGYGSIVIQSGERSDRSFTDFIETILREISRLSYAPGITLSCGEQSFETYCRWRDAGAKRYLLRIESSDPALFAAIHPAGTSYRARRMALHRLRRAGYQLGTGVMIGLPGQTVEQLAKDIKFFRDMDVDMIGMGPFLPQDDTPLGKQFPDTPGAPEERLKLSLRMIAVARLVLRDVNIASTTALQAIDPAQGREKGLLAGANVIMPNVGSTSHRRDYQLYNGKPALDENAGSVRQALIASLAAIGERPRLDGHGDPLHFFRRNGKLK